MNRLLSICLLLYIFSIGQVQSQLKYRGVNLGSWLVFEGFLKPSIEKAFPGVSDEWTWGEFIKNNPARRPEVIQHWDTWVTEEDVKKLSEHGINFLRIPVGYWIVMTQEELNQYNEPFNDGGWEYLVRAVSWAKKYNVKVIIGLHCAPGGQNPWPHAGVTRPNPQWGTGDTIARTVEYIGRIAQRVQQFQQDPTVSDTVEGIGIVNEPTPNAITGGLETVKTYYLAAYDKVREYLDEKYMVLIDTAFNSDFGPGFLEGEQYKNIVIDLHSYQCFDPFLRLEPYKTHIEASCVVDANRMRAQKWPIITGEWSLCYKEEAFTAATEPFPNAEQQLFMKQFAMAQIQTYEMQPYAIGWTFWSFKTESAPMWDYLLGIDNGWLPCNLPLTDAEVASACNTNPAMAQALWPCEGRANNITLDNYLDFMNQTTTTGFTATTAGPVTTGTTGVRATTGTTGTTGQQQTNNTATTGRPSGSTTGSQTTTGQQQSTTQQQQSTTGNQNNASTGVTTQSQTTNNRRDDDESNGNIVMRDWVMIGVSLLCAVVAFA